MIQFKFHGFALLISLTHVNSESRLPVLGATIYDIDLLPVGLLKTKT